MRLRTLAGAYAGEIRDYAFGAAQAALKAGFAEPIDVETPRPVVTRVEAPESPRPRKPRRKQE